MTKDSFHAPQFWEFSLPLPRHTRETREGPLYLLQQVGIWEGQFPKFRSGRVHSGNSPSLPLPIKRETCHIEVTRRHLHRAIQTPILLSYYSLFVMADKFIWKQGYYGTSFQTFVFNKKQSHITSLFSCLWSYRYNHSTRNFFKELCHIIYSDKENPL